MSRAVDATMVKINSIMRIHIFERVKVKNTKVVGDAADLLEPDPEPAQDRDKEQVVEDVCRVQAEGQAVVCRASEGDAWSDGGRRERE